MRNIVNGILLKEDQVLLTYRSRVRAFYPDCWSFPGGHVETGETLEVALARELTEEIDVEPTQFELLGDIVISTDTKSLKARFHMFVVTNWTGEPRLLGSEHTQMIWVPISKVAAMENLALEEYRPMLDRLSKEGIYGLQDDQI